MSVQNLVKELKENNEDNEFYPSTKEMVKVIYDKIQANSYRKSLKVLDIGCGTCNFGKYFNEFVQQGNNREVSKISTYLGIEKSKILINKLLETDTILVGTDFNNTYLLDKKADIYFCNPPYSEFKEWTSRIISEGNFKYAYLIIPSRWKDCEDIQRAISNSNVEVEILGNFDFLNADRIARAYVDVIQVKNLNTNKYDSIDDIRQDSFDRWFEETFKDGKENSKVSEMEKFTQKNISKELATCKTKAQTLIEYYQEELNKLFLSFKAITQLDESTLAEIGVDTNKVKEAIIEKSTGLKNKYWALAINQLEEITDRLTTSSRREIFENFKRLSTVDFTMENIWMITMCILKHSKDYYDEQLLTFYDGLTNPQNIVKYKSNQRVFRLNKYRPDIFDEKVSHYVLNYRIVTQKTCDTDWYGNIRENNNGFKHYNTSLADYIHDIITIAKNLGFMASRDFNTPNSFNSKTYVYYEDKPNKPFMEYKVFKNGNVHIKFDIEFMKALNVEAGRLCGWLNSPQEASEEFPAEMKENLDKYFKVQYDCLSCNNQNLLGLLK